jgi:DNA-damage-inducible protein D
MKKEIIKRFTGDFKSYANQTSNEIEFWFARDLQYLLNYTKWDNFLKVINKAKIACDTSGHQVTDHFADIGKMVKIGSGTEREIKDFMLNRETGSAPRWVRKMDQELD